jgi:hypothetical protein
VLDDVERRRFLVQPAGEHPSPAVVGTLDVDLDKASGQPFRLPRRGLLARPKADEEVVLPPGRLAGPHRDVADDAVALVQYAEDRDALGHRRHARDARAAGGRLRRRTGVLLLLAAVAGGQRQAERGHQAEADGRV